MALRSFGYSVNLYDRSVGVPPDHGATLIVQDNYYAPYVSLGTEAGTLWTLALAPGGSFSYGSGAASGIAVTPLLGADAGDYLATWHTGQPGGADRLVGEVFDNTGQALTGVFQLSSETDPAQFGTAVALPGGGFLALFADSSHAGNQYLYQQSYGSGADAYIASRWLAEGFDLAGRLYDSSFNATGADFLVQPPSSAIVGDQWQVSPVLLHNGTIAVAYSDDHFYGISPSSTADMATQIRVEFLSASGAMLSNLLVDVDSGPAYGFANPPLGSWSYNLPAAHPAIFVTQQGFGLLWQASGGVTYGPSTGDQVHWLNFQLFDNAGHALGAEVHLRDDLASVNYDAFFRDYGFTGTQLANGHVVVAYSVNLAAGRQVFLQEFTAGGALLGGPVQVSSGAGAHDIGALYADDGGNVALGLVQPDGHQDLLTFSERQHAFTTTFADGSYNVTTYGITGHDWTTSVADYTPSGLLFRESLVDAANHLWKHYDLGAGGVTTTDIYDAAGVLVRSTVEQADGSYSVTSNGITDHAWTTIVASYTSADVLLHATYTDAASHLWKSYDLGGDGTATTLLFDAAGAVVRSTIAQADGSSTEQILVGGAVSQQVVKHADGSSETETYLVPGDASTAYVDFHGASGAFWRQINNADGSHTLHGYSDNLTLASTAANDLITATPANMTVVFYGSFGHDTLTDFTATGAGHDRLEFDASVFADAGAVLAAAHRVAGGMLITVDAGDDVLMKGFTATTLAGVDMLFA